MEPMLLRGAYDREAPRYDARFEAQQIAKARIVAEVVVPPPPGTRVLDLGAGTGLLPRTLGSLDPRWRTCRWTLVDLSTRMLAIARGHQLTGTAADARRLPLRTASFPLALSLTGIVAAEHVGAVLTSAARVLSDDGRFVLTLRPRDVPDDLAELLAGLPFACLGERDAAGDRLLDLRRRPRGA